MRRRGVPSTDRADAVLGCLRPDHFAHHLELVRQINLVIGATSPAARRRWRAERRTIDL